MLVIKDLAKTYSSGVRALRGVSLDGQARMRVISKGQRPSEEFTPATPILEDYYLELVNRQELDN